MTETKKPLLSIIISAHHEGLIAHKTLLSVKRALEDADFSYEIIATLDNPDEATKHYFANQSIIRELKVYEVAFKDLAASRNYGVSVAKGKYVATLDADDLVSKNWFSTALKHVSSAKKDIIAHTHYSVNFGTQDIIWEKCDARSKDEDALIMVGANRWDSAILASRKTLVKYPYTPNTKGFGSEDWHFNSETLAAGIPHVVTPETILFVRRKDVSEMTIQASDRRTVRYTSLLDFKYVSQIDITPYYGKDSREPRTLTLDVTPLLKKGAKLSYHHFRRLPVIGNYADKAKERFFAKDPAAKFPAWLIQEWKAIHDIDREIFPSRDLLFTVPIYRSEVHEIGVFYHHVVKYFTKNPDYIIFVPYLIKGGADLVAINYANTIKRLNPGAHVAVVATENVSSIWADRLDDDVDFVPFGEIAGELDKDLKLQILARLVVQSKAKKLHVIQSYLAFDFVSTYKTLLQQNDYTVYACTFCDDADKEGRVTGHAHTGIPKAYPVLAKIFTDNNAVIQQLVGEYGYDSKRFTTHYQPMLPEERKWQPHNKKPLRILWASRISRQKCPEILMSIASQLDPENYQIDVFGTFENGYTPRDLMGVPSLQYKGQFNGLLSLPIEDYDLFLYTSEYDGLPNTILEVASTGTPIVAPNVGGVSEVVSPQSGGLIEDFSDVEAYVSTIEQLANDPKKLKKLSSHLLKVIDRRHTWEQFDKTITDDIIT